MTGYTIMTITHASSASCTITPFGGHVLAYIPPSGGDDLLWLSTTHKTDQTKSIRGGIPVCFPQFGKTHDRVSPQHGWARLNSWSVHASTPSSITLTLACGDADKGRGGHWPIAGCPFSVTLWLNVCFTEAGSLKYTLGIRNQLQTSVPVQVLLHNYFKFDITSQLVQGVEGYDVEDTQPGFAGRKFFVQDGAIKIDKEVSEATR